MMFSSLGIPFQEKASFRNLRTISVCLSLLLMGFLIGQGFNEGLIEVNSSSPEVGFARDMAVHHSQAVEMAVLLRDRTEDPEMDQLALDILLTQQAQIGQFQGWLILWGMPIASAERAMSWMGMPMNGLMPGMASRSEISELTASNGKTADLLFLKLMISHHQGGIAMATAILDLTNNERVLKMASAIVESQTSEIRYMQQLLDHKQRSSDETNLN